ncbi:MAG: MarR family winged helix-turn-helix transcriptional regulator [Patulibacter sp.]|nr:MarR family winged helix-turn-helix transcriptional regulator [Patulibacter sp.]
MGEAFKSPAFVAYYGLLQLHAQTLERIERDFEAQAGFPASWYELMACVEGEHAEGKRMNELADILLISRGGATKLVARMEEAGYVERVTPKHDRRATFARLTPKGAEAAAAAHPIQLALVEQYFGSHVDQADLDDLTRIADKVLKGIDAECSWLDEIKGSEVAKLAEGAQA